MKKLLISTSFLMLLVLGAATQSQAQNPVNWTPEQLMAPADLAQTLTATKDTPIIISVGPGAIIPGSIDAGMASTKEGLEKLKTQLQSLPKDKKVVVYCGCCPFERCPNARPAVAALKDMQFTNYYLLNLPHNIKQDWIDKGYPVAKQ